ncbi:MAG TPA: hypothetical protein VK524_09345, partial [Polyangiaceae bacterium]|nr:hypothetical protein [Polyangiaceae bacterium]
TASFLLGREAEPLQGSANDATVFAERTSRYAEPEAVTAVTNYLSVASRNSSTPRRVYFIPESDALLFESQRSPALRFVHSVHCAFHQADVIILHDSPWLTEHHYRMGLISAGFKHGVEAPLDQWRVLHTAPDGNRWLVYQKRSPAYLSAR